MASHSERTNIIIHWIEERNLEERLRKKRLEFLERQHQERQVLAKHVKRKMEDYNEKINSEWQRLKELREHMKKAKKENAALKEENHKLSHEIIQVREGNLLMRALYKTREEKRDLQWLV